MVVFVLLLMKSPETLFSGCPHIRMSVCLLIFSVFSATAYLIDTVFTVGATTHAECFNDNYDVIGHVLWWPCWKKRKNFGSSVSSKSEKIETCRMPSASHGKCEFFFF